MSHSIIKEEDIAEFQYFSENTPESITDKAACFVYFIEKGWANTRAAERCFEFGNEDLVLFLVMKKLRANPDLQDALKKQGVWNDHWERRLENEEFSPDTLIVQFKWQGIVVEIVYKPRWLGSMMDHLDVTTVMPPRSPLPITLFSR